MLFFFINKENDLEKTETLFDRKFYLKKNCIEKIYSVIEHKFRLRRMNSFCEK